MSGFSSNHPHRLSAKPQDLYLLLTAEIRLFTRLSSTLLVGFGETILMTSRKSSYRWYVCPVRLAAWFPRLQRRNRRWLQITYRLD